MRSSTFLLAGPVAVSAQALSSITGGTQTATISSGSEVLYTTTWTYSNPATNYLSLTDSAGVVTGQPTSGGSNGAVTSQPSVITSQPTAANLPAGLPTGETYFPVNGTAGFSSVHISVGSSTTVILGGGSGATTGSGSSPSGSGSSSSGGSGSNSNSGSDSSSGSGSGSDSSASGSSSASASQSGNAGSSVRVAGAGIGFFAFIAALL